MNGAGYVLVFDQFSFDGGCIQELELEDEDEEDANDKKHGKRSHQVPHFSAPRQASAHAPDAIKQALHSPTKSIALFGAEEKVLDDQQQGTWKNTLRECTEQELINFALRINTQKRVRTKRLQIKELSDHFV